MFFGKEWKPGFPFMYRTPNYEIDSSIIAIEVGYNYVPIEHFQIFQRNVYILHYIASGKGYFLGQPFDDKNGYFVAANELEKIESGNEHPYESYWIMFKGEATPALLKKLNFMHNCIFTIKNKDKCIDCIKEVLFKDDYSSEAEEAYALQSALYKIFSLHTNEIDSLDNSSSYSMAQIVANTIRKNYNTPLKISELANNFHITRNQLFIQFKKEFGLSPQEYLISRRIDKAKQLLKSRTPHLSIKEIAYSVGFNDPLYFSRIFQERLGVSPSKYRKNIDDLNNKY